MIPALAFASPGIPNQFYGTVSFTSGTTPDGLTVEVKVDGMVVGTSITKDGKYGYMPSLLFASKTEGEWVGETATFYVGGIQATTATAITLSKGGYTNLDLTVPGSVGTITKSESEVITDQSATVTPSSPTLINMGSSLNVNVSSSTSTTATIAKVEKLSSSFFTGATAVLAGNNVLNAYEIKIQGTSLTISVTMKYDDTGIDETTVKPYKYNGSAWVAITPYTRDTTANTLTFSIPAAATPYALFGSSTQQSGGGDGNGGNNNSGGGGGNNTTTTTTTPATTKKGDANGDGKVDKYDFALMMSDWGKTGTSNSDFNVDGKVDKYDFALLMSNWGL